MKYPLAALAIAGLLAIAASAQNARAPDRPCQDVKASLYFGAYDTSLSQQSSRTLNAIGDRLERCDVSVIEMDVLSEEAHTEEDMSRLSEARAETVRDELVRHGVQAQRIHTDMSRVEATAARAEPAVERVARRISLTLKVNSGYGA